MGWIYLLSIGGSGLGESWRAVGQVLGTSLSVATWSTLLHSIGVLVHWCFAPLHWCTGTWCTVAARCTWCSVHCCHLVPPGRSNNCNTTTGPGTTAQHRPSSSYSCPTLPSVITLRFLAIWSRSSTVAPRLLVLIFI